MLSSSTKSNKTMTVGIVGHVDHGKSTLTAGLTAVAHKLNPDKNPVKLKVTDIDNTIDEQRSGITINTTYINVIHTITNDSGEKEDIHIQIADCPGHEKFVAKTAVGALAFMQQVIVVISMKEGAMKQTVSHLKLVKNSSQIQKVWFVLTRADEVDDEYIELAKLEVSDHAQDLGLKSYEIFVVSGLRPTDEEYQYGYPEFVRLLNSLASADITYPDASGDVIVHCDGSVSITGRGQVFTGITTHGTLRRGEKLDFFANGEKFDGVSVADLHSFRVSIPEAPAGKSVGVLLKGLPHKDKTILSTSTIATPNTLKLYKAVRAFFKVENFKGSRNKPIKVNFSPSAILTVNKTTSTIKQIFDLNHKPIKVAQPGDSVYIDLLFHQAVPLHIRSETPVTLTDRDGVHKFESWVSKTGFVLMESRITVGFGYIVDEVDPSIYEKATKKTKG